MLSDGIRTAPLSPRYTTHRVERGRRRARARRGLGGGRTDARGALAARRARLACALLPFGSPRRLAPAGAGGGARRLARRGKSCRNAKCVLCQHRAVFLLMGSLQQASTFCRNERLPVTYMPRVEVEGGSTAGATAIVHFGSVGRLWGLFERSKAT